MPGVWEGVHSTPEHGAVPIKNQLWDGAEIPVVLALGVDASALEEEFGVRENTIRTWLYKSGVQGRQMRERFMVELNLIHVQLDELHPALGALAV